MSEGAQTQRVRWKAFVYFGENVKILYGYLIICAVLFTIMLGIAVYEDFIKRKPDSKFGYNFQWPPWKSMWFFMTVIIACPGVNIFMIVGSLLVARFNMWKDRKWSKENKLEKDLTDLK